MFKRKHYHYHHMCKECTVHPHPDCGCKKPASRCEPEPCGCPIKLDTDCVIYTGDKKENTGINKGDTLTTIIDKIDEAIGRCCNPEAPDTSPRWEVVSGETGCSSSQVDYIPWDSSGGGMGYYVETTIDNNPLSATYRDRVVTRKPNLDSTCIATNAEWTTQGYGCSTVTFSYVPNEGSPDAKYGFRNEKDINPNSSTYNDERWIRDTSRDSMCDVYPEWTTVTSQTGCSTSTTQYIAWNENSGESGYYVETKKDNNPNSPTYNQTQVTHISANDGQCQITNSTDPVWTIVSNQSGCSTSSTSYNPWNSNSGNDGYYVETFRDSNPHSPTYNQTKVERDSSKDGQCQVNVSTDPEWTTVPAQTGCSTSSTQYIAWNENSGFDGYYVETKEDTNPNSPTYGQTQVTHISANDGQCQNNVPEWELQSNESGCSKSKITYMPWADDEGLDGFYVNTYIDNNPNSSTYQQTKIERDISKDGQCKSTEPVWQVDTSRTGCSSTNVSYIAWDETTGQDGFYVQTVIDVNPYSPTYQNYQIEYLPQNNSQCKSISTIEPVWTIVPAQTGCSTSQSSYVPWNENSESDGYYIETYRDSNPNSPTYNQTQVEYSPENTNLCRALSAQWQIVPEQTGCSTSENSYIPWDENSGVNGYYVETYIDANPASPTYEEYKTERDSLRDGDCRTTVPLWQIVPGKTGCSSSPLLHQYWTEYSGNDGYYLETYRDFNNKSATFGDEKVVRVLSRDGECAKNDTDEPGWTKVNNLSGCSISKDEFDRWYDTDTEVGYYVETYEDMNPNSPTYQSHKAVWVEENDYSCIPTGPNWTLVPEEVGCSLSTADYQPWHESSNMDGFYVETYIDTNPYSQTYQDIEVRHISNKDSQCKVISTIEPVWTYMPNMSGCSISENTYIPWDESHSSDGYFVETYRDANPNSPTYNTYEIQRRAEYDGQCIARGPKWMIVPELTGCSSREDEYEAWDELDGSHGFYVETFKDMNHLSDTFQQLRVERRSDKDEDCLTTAPNWQTYPGETGCSSSPDIYLQWNPSGNSNGYYVKTLRDTNPRSATYGSKIAEHIPENDGECELE